MVVQHLQYQQSEAGGSLQVRGQPGSHRELQDSQGYVERPCLRKRREEKTFYIPHLKHWILPLFPSPQQQWCPCHSECGYGVRSVSLLVIHIWKTVTLEPMGF